MPSLRRLKIFGLLVLVIVVTILLFTNAAREQKDMGKRGDFYSKTKDALEKTHTGGGAATGDKGKANAEDAEVARAMSERLKEAAQVAKDNANAKAPKPDPPSKIVGVGSAAEGAEKKGVSGRKKYSAGGDAQKPVLGEKLSQEEEEDVQVELNSILQKSPIIIFSKSYCPHSARAKRILLEKYLLDPQPYVVELDQHKIGLQLQAKLADLTSRTTVPNVLINGVSIGGGDDVAEFDSNKQLIDKIKNLGGKRMTVVKLRPLEESKAEEKAEEVEEKEEGHDLR